MNRNHLKEIMAKYFSPKPAIQTQPKKKLSPEDVKSIERIKQLFTGLDTEDRHIALQWLKKILGYEEEALANLLVLSILASDKQPADHIQDGTYWAIEYVTRYYSFDGPQQLIPHLPFFPQPQRIDTHTEKTVVNAVVVLNNLPYAHLFATYTKQQIEDCEQYIDLVNLFVAQTQNAQKDFRWVVVENELAQNVEYAHNSCK